MSKEEIKELEEAIDDTIALIDHLSGLMQTVDQKSLRFMQEQKELEHISWLLKERRGKAVPTNHDRFTIGVCIRDAIRNLDAYEKHLHQDMDWAMQKYKGENTDELREFQDEINCFKETFAQIDTALDDLRRHMKKILTLNGCRREADGTSTKLKDETKG